MRSFVLWLVVVLTLPTVGSVRRLHIDSPVLRPIPKDLQDVLVSANKLFAAGDFVTSAPIYRAGLESATTRHETRAISRFLHGAGNCHLLVADYAAAVHEYLEARKLAIADSDWAMVTLLSINLYTAYDRMHDLPAAAQSIQFAAGRIPSASLKGNLPRVLISMAAAEGSQNHPEKALSYFSEAIQVADQQADLPASVQAWNELGTYHLRRREFGPADVALTKAYYLRRMNGDVGIADSYRDLGELRYESGDPASALALLNAGLAVAKRSVIGFPTFRLYNGRARAYAALGEFEKSLADFETALDLAGQWRLDLVSTDSSRTEADVSLQKIYDGYIETGMKLYAANRSRALAYKIFQAAEQNRALSFRERLNRQKKFPAEYWQTLANLRRAEIAVFRSNSPKKDKSLSQLRLQLAEIEAQLEAPDGTAASTYSHRINENSRSVNSLTPFQRLITDREALISFSLGESASCVWAFTSRGFEVHTLPGRNRIAILVRTFREAVRTSAPDATAQGRQLYKLLFGPLEPLIAGKRDWLLVLDDTLFELPLAALVTSHELAEPSYLVERNTLRVLPAAGMLVSHRPSQAAGPFLGIGDPIYNTADSRWPEGQKKPYSWQTLLHFARTNPTAGPPAFTRLVGSGREVQVSAAAWQSPVPAILLQGKLSERSQIEHHLKTGPAVVHFATHVVQPSNQPDQAMIAIGLDPSGEADFLTTTEISNWRYPLGLVVLSGCSSGTGKALPGAGLFGLTRAWLLAGARAVTASQWPTPDDSGPLFLNFYESLRLTGQELSSASVADALRTAQIEMLRSGTWRAQPRFWAAFFVVGKD